MEGTIVTAWEGKHLRVRQSGRWEYAERTKASAGVVVVAVTPEERILLVEQFRVPVGKTVIELPAGLAGDEADAEEFLTAARRELLEETGYEASEWEQVASGPCTAGLSNEIVVFFRARGLKQVQVGGGCDEEDIRVYQVPLAEVEPWLRRKEAKGCLIDPKIFAGLYFLRPR